MTDNKQNNEFELQALSGKQSAQTSNNSKPKRGSSSRGRGRSDKNKHKHNSNTNKRPRHDTHTATTSTIARKVDRRPRRNDGMNPMHRKKADTIPPIEEGAVRVIMIGGVEEVGRNMYAIETYEDVFVFDVGFEFTTDEEAPGMDYSLPNTTYLEEHRDKIKGIVITHAHLDHIGGIPFLIERLGNPPIYTRNLTALMIQKRMEEFPNTPRLDIRVVDDHSHHRIGSTEFYFFPVSHSIPDCIAASVRTPYGNIIITGDIKLEHEDGVPVPYEVEHWAKVKDEDNLLLVSDSTNCENPGWSLPEPVIHETVAQIITDAPSRVIIAAFASHFRRMIEFVRTAENLGKKVVLEGRSMKVNLELARLAGYFEPQDGTIIPSSDIKEYAPDRIVVLCTGGQGEQFAALPRMARGEHPDIAINERDTVVFSSSVIPGNENQVRGLMDLLWRKDCRIVHYKTDDVHSTGHGNQEELKWIINKVGAKWFMPAYGYHSMLKQHRKLALEVGVEDENIVVPDDGSIIEIKSQDDIQKLDVKVPSQPLMVDGFTVSAINNTIMSDRQALAKDGIFVVVVSINVQKKVMQKSPDIISRGFVYLRESQELLSRARGMIRKITEDEIRRSQGGKIDVDKLKKDINRQVERYLVRETNKNPVVIPVVLVV
jgi:ribonuclease J